MLLTFIMFLSCGRQKGDNELLPIVKEWYGKEVKFPDHPVFTLYGKDTVDYSIPQSPYKVLVYVDSSGCVDCKLQLQKWQELIKYTNSISDGEIPFLFFFFPKKRQRIQTVLLCAAKIQILSPSILHVLPPENRRP